MRAVANLVFDLDGTISDPILGITRCINFSLKHFGYATIPEGAASRYVGPPIDETFQSITGASSSEHVAELVAKYRERYAEVGYSENVLYAGIPEVLESLASAGLSLGLCTSKRADFAESILRLFHLHPHFTFVDGGDVGVRKQAQLARLLANGAISCDSIMIGDRATDIEAARANGVRSAGVLWGHGSRDELEAAHPDHLFSHPRQLMELEHAV